MCPYKSIKCALWIITLGTTVKLLPVQPWCTREKPVTKIEAQKVDFYKFLAINFVYLGNKTINSILKDILYHLCFISNKLTFNAETQCFSFKDYSCFCEACVIKQTPPEKTT